MVNGIALCSLPSGTETGGQLTGFFQKGADVKAQDDHGASTLMQASLNADINVMRLLLDKGADVNASDPNGATALLWAGHDPEKVRLLLNYGARISEEVVFASVAIPGCWSGAQAPRRPRNRFQHQPPTATLIGA
jgi:hypothetical protein